MDTPEGTEYESRLEWLLLYYRDIGEGKGTAAATLAADLIRVREHSSSFLGKLGIIDRPGKTP